VHIIAPGQTTSGKNDIAAHTNKPITNSNSGFQYEEAYHRGMKHVEKKDYKRAVSEFSEAISVSPEKLKSYIQRAKCYMKANRFEPAIDDYTTVIDKTPGDSQLFTKRAQAKESLHKYSDAICDYTKSLELEPNKKEVHLARGKTFVLMNNLSSALEDFGKVIEIDIRCDEGYRQRAEVYGRLKKFELSLRDYNQVLELETRSHRGVKIESLLSRADTLMKIAEEEEKSYSIELEQDDKVNAAEEGITNDSVSIASNESHVFQGILFYIVVAKTQLSNC